MQKEPKSQNLWQKIKAALAKLKTKPKPQSQKEAQSPPVKENRPAAAAEQQPLTPEQIKIQQKTEKCLRSLLGYGYKISYEFEGPNQTTTVGIGDLGLHARIIDNNETEYVDEKLNLKMKENLDKDSHISIKKSDITGLLMEKKKIPNPENSEKPFTQYDVLIFFPGGRLLIPFREEYRSMAIGFKRILWQWSNGLPVSTPEELDKISKLY